MTDLLNTVSQDVFAEDRQEQEKEMMKFSRDISPAGFIKLPLVHEFTEKDWRKLTQLTEAHKAAAGENPTNHDLAKRNAAILADLAYELGVWEFPKMQKAKFKAEIVGDSGELPVEFVYWLSKIMKTYVEMLTNPNVIAAN